MPIALRHSGENPRALTITFGSLARKDITAMHLPASNLAIQHRNRSRATSSPPLDQFSRVTGRRSGSLGGGAQACVSSWRLA
jgi:hypothetical protein